MNKYVLKTWLKEVVHLSKMWSITCGRTDTKLGENKGKEGPQLYQVTKELGSSLPEIMESGLEWKNFRLRYWHVSYPRSEAHQLSV